MGYPTSFTRRFLVLVVLCWFCLPAPDARAGPDEQQPAPRRRVGVAFGGGSARGLAHVGVVRWFEEHRIPIDLVAGTSMGGLIGGAFASGMSSDELKRLLEDTDWDEMFGFSSFRYKNVRRKADARDYPSRIEFGLKRGLTPPLSLNNGQQVDFLLGRIAGPYLALKSFDELPTPFRALAVDLVTSQQIILDSGLLASALRATMSLPGVFPPVESDGRVLVDGGALNNVPADVVRAMGADVVIAINVGFMGEKRDVSLSMLGLMGQTVDVMMHVSTRNSMKAADIIINPTLEGFASMDWRRSSELAEEGYRAAEALKDKLLPFAVDETTWNAYQEARRARRKMAFPSPEFLSVNGASKSDQARIERVLAPRVGVPLNVPALETDLETFAGLDRYETVGWSIVEDNGKHGLKIDARPKSYAPPFLMLGVALQNTTTDDFAFQLSGRYLTFDLLGPGSELRIDGTVGAQPSIAAEIYKPLGKSALFVAAYGGVRNATLNFVSEDIVVAKYSQTRQLAGFDVGVNLGRDSDVRLGMTIGQLDTSVDAGDPGLPELHGQETKGRLQWRYDGQDSPVVPSRGAAAIATITHIFDSPALPDEFVTDRSNDDVTQLEVRSSVFRSMRKRHRLFLSGGLGTTWGDPLATEQFQLGAPMRLSAFNLGELRGDHYGVVTAGYLHGVGRLPDFLGGSIYLGGWLENGSAFDDIDDADFHSNVGIGMLADTLIGPMMLGGSFDFSGNWRYYVAIGRIF